MVRPPSYDEHLSLIDKRTKRKLYSGCAFMGTFIVTCLAVAILLMVILL